MLGGRANNIYFAWHRFLWSINKQCLPPQTALACVPRWEGWQSCGAWGEVLREAFLVESQRSRHKNVWLAKWIWLCYKSALEWKPALGPSLGPGWKLSCWASALQHHLRYRAQELSSKCCWSQGFKSFFFFLLHNRHFRCPLCAALQRSGS